MMAEAGFAFEGGFRADLVINNLYFTWIELKVFPSDY